MCFLAKNSYKLVSLPWKLHNPYYHSEHAPLDLLILQNTQMLELMLKTEPDIEKTVKSFVLMEDVKSSGNIISWNEMLDRGSNVDDSVLTEKEKEQAVNQACMLIYTSGTTGPPKGIYRVFSHF